MLFESGYRAHKGFETRGGVDHAQPIDRWQRLPPGISIENVVRQFEGREVAKFNKSFEKLMEILAQRSPRHLTKDS